MDIGLNDIVVEIAKTETNHSVLDEVAINYMFD